MTPEERDAAVERLVRQAREEQGLPEYVEDPVVLAQIAQILQSSMRETKQWSK